MKITITSTDKIVHLIQGETEIPARIWEGHTDSGIPVHCYITRIAVAEGQDTSEFEKELQLHVPGSPEVRGISLRLIL